MMNIRNEPISTKVQSKYHGNEELAPQGTGLVTQTGFRLQWRPPEQITQYTYHSLITSHLSVAKLFPVKQGLDLTPEPLICGQGGGRTTQHSGG